VLVVEQQQSLVTFLLVATCSTAKEELGGYSVISVSSRIRYFERRFNWIQCGGGNLELEASKPTIESIRANPEAQQRKKD